MAIYGFSQNIERLAWICSMFAAACRPRRPPPTAASVTRLIMRRIPTAADRNDRGIIELSRNFHQIDVTRVGFVYKLRVNDDNFFS
jgi:hypothetical protein